MDTPGTTLGKTGTVLEESTMMQNNPEMSKGAFDNSRTFSILLSLFLFKVLYFFKTNWSASSSKW